MKSVDLPETRSHPHATIGFVIYYPFQFYVYQNIYNELKADAEFIIDLCHPFSPEKQTRLLRDITMLLDTHRVSYRILYREDYRRAEYLEAFFSTYKCLISVWERGCVQRKATSHTKKINVTYGAGKELTMVRPSRGLHDLILAYGERDAKLFSNYTKTKIVGNPKFDGWFNGQLDQEFLDHIKGSIDRNKPTLLYLPTHSDLSSIDDIAPELWKVTPIYNVLVKTHYYTTHEEPERMMKLQQEGILLFGDDADLLPLLKSADVVLSDNSSVIFDAILADKPVIVADFWDQEFLDVQHKEMRFYTRGKQGALTYSGSIEQVIKRDGKVVTLKKGEYLKDKIAEALRDDEHFKRARAELRKELFVFNDGKCGVRAAEAIRACMADTSPPSRPILYHAMEAYKRRLGRLSYARERMLNKKIANYESVLYEKIAAEEKGTVFSVVVLPREANADVHEQSRRSLAEQAFPRDTFEVVELELGPTLGERVAAAVAKAKGRIICFTTDDCLLPSDWLTTLYLAYERYPYIVGVGGYVRAAEHTHTVYDKYFYWDLGRKLNVDSEHSFLSKLYEVQNQLVFQNPSGDMRAMSYKKEYLPPGMQSIQKFYELELYLKLHTMVQRPLGFIPLSVSRLAPMTHREFVSAEHERGFFERVARDSIMRISSYQRPRLTSIFIDPLQAFRMATPNRILPLVIALGRLSRWLGALHATVLILRKANDTHVLDR